MPDIVEDSVTLAIGMHVIGGYPTMASSRFTFRGSGSRLPSPHPLTPSSFAPTWGSVIDNSSNYAGAFRAVAARLGSCRTLGGETCKS